MDKSFWTNLTRIDFHLAQVCFKRIFETRLVGFPLAKKILCACLSAVGFMHVDYDSSISGQFDTHEFRETAVDVDFVVWTEVNVKLTVSDSPIVKVK